jgi:transposase
MDERLQFVARRLAGEPMAELCREFGISRKTGYKIFDRYQEWGVQGLTDRSRRPYRYAHQLPFQVENYILNVKREYASWGARKIRERLIRRFSGIKIPRKHHSRVARSPWSSCAPRSSASSCPRNSPLHGPAPQ